MKLFRIWAADTTPLNTFESINICEIVRSRESSKVRKGIESCNGIKLCDNQIAELSMLNTLGFRMKLSTKLGGLGSMKQFRIGAPDTTALNTFESIGLCEIVRRRERSKASEKVAPPEIQTQFKLTGM